MTVQTYEATQRGPIILKVSVTAGAIDVRADERVTHAMVRIVTADETGPSADAVRAARISEDGSVLSIYVPQQDTIVTGRSRVQFGNGNVQVNSFGGVFVGRDMHVDMHGGGGFATVAGSSDIRIEVAVPPGSDLEARTVSGDIETSGRMGMVKAKSQSGDIRLNEVASPNLETMSGDVIVTGLAGDGSMKSMSGDVRVTAVRPCSLRARTMSGDVHVTGARVSLDASSMSGRVRHG